MVGPRIAVTGAGGFVGGALAAAYRRRGGVTVFPLCRPSFELCDSSTFNAIPRDIDVMVHAAGVVGDGHKARSLWQVNVIATQVLVEHLNSHPQPPYVLFLSTGGASGQEGRFGDECRGLVRRVYTRSRSILPKKSCASPTRARGQLRGCTFHMARGEHRSGSFLGSPRASQRASRSRSSGTADQRSVRSTSTISSAFCLASSSSAGLASAIAGREAITIAELASELGALLATAPRFVETSTPALDYCARPLPGFAYTPIRDGLRTTLRNL